VSLSLEEKLAGQKQIRALEATRNGKRKALFEAQDEIDRKREQLINVIEGKLTQQASLTSVFQLRWRITKMPTNEERLPRLKPLFAEDFSLIYQKLLPQTDLNGQKITMTQIAFTLFSWLFTRSILDLNDIAASGAVVDGDDDGGIDAIYFDRSRCRLLLVQSKYKKNGAAPAQHENLKTING